MIPRCLALLVGALTALLASAWLASGARAADRIYWGNANNNTISFANLSGGGGGELSTTGATPNFPTGVAIDPAAGKVYWADAFGNTISFANLDGSGGGGHLNTAGATALSTPEGLAIDRVGGRIYWANRDHNTISFARLDNSGGGDVNTTGTSVSSPVGVALDFAGGRIYWGNAGNNMISFANLDGSGGGGNLSTVGATKSSPAGVAIDPTTRKIYWTNPNAGISFANLSGTGGGDLNTSGATVNHPQGLAVDPVHGKVYWTNSTAGLSFANLDDSGGGEDLNTSGATVSTPLLPSLLEAPSGSGAPAVSGGGRVGQRLACSQGGWATDLAGSLLYRAPRTFDYQWLRNGAIITGATINTYTPTAADSYTCRVTASNQAGSTPQISAPLTVVGGAVVAGAPTALRASPSTFKLTGRKVKGRCVKPAAKNNNKPHCKRPIALHITYTLSAPATVKFTLKRLSPGRKVRGRCVKPNNKNNKHNHCTQERNVPGSITSNAKTGANSFTFTGKIGGRKIGPGNYQLTATTAGGSRSIKLRIVR